MNTHYDHIKMFRTLATVARSIEPVANARLSAAIVYKNELVSIGTNRRKSHPFQKKFGKNSESIYMHAEISAIKEALKILTLQELSKSTLYICRMKFPSSVDKNMIYGLARPCEGCMRAIVEFKINKVIYSLDNDKYEIL